MMDRLFPRKKSPIQRLEEKKAEVEMELIEKRRKNIHRKDDDFDIRESAEDYGQRLSARRKRGY